MNVVTDLIESFVKNEVAIDYFRQVITGLIKNSPDLISSIIKMIYSPKLGYPSIKLIHKMTGIAVPLIKKVLSGIKSYSLHKKASKVKYRRVKAFAVDEIWSCDIVDMREYWNELDGINYRYILNIIDVFSKYVWSFPLSFKTMQEVYDSFVYLEEQDLIPKKIWCDKGKEFYNRLISEYLDRHDITMYSTQSGDKKACIIERYNRTQKEMLQKVIEENDGIWITHLQEITLAYNNREHAFHGLTPRQARLKKNSKRVLSKFIKKPKSMHKPKFKVGDQVRIIKWKKQFEKGHTNKWTREVFIIDSVHRDNVPYYILVDLDGESIKGSFTGSELQKIN